MPESPLIVAIIGIVMALMIAVTVFDAYEQHGGRVYEAPKEIIAMFSAVVSAAIWFRFKRKDK